MMKKFGPQQIKRSVYVFIRLLYNAGLLHFSYTTLYTVVCENMTFLRLWYTNLIPKPIFTTTIGFVFWQIPNTYQLLLHILVIYHSSKILICLRWCWESFWLKNYIILLDIPFIYWWCGHYGIFVVMYDTVINALSTKSSMLIIW